MLQARKSRVPGTILLIIIVPVLCTSAFGKIVREWWLDVPGASVSDLTSDPRYPNSPDGRELLDIFEGPVNWGNNYGSRFRGWLLPPKSGEYTFWIASDDCSELRLSINEDPSYSQVIASVNGWIRSREWEKYDTQKSEPILLQAGYKYYIEALMKESGGGDNIAVAWQPPEGTREVISGEFVDTFSQLQAFSPVPADGTICTNDWVNLSWMPGELAALHDVYFGTDLDAVAQRKTSTLVATTDVTFASVVGLQMGTTYYWCVDEVNDSEPDSSWQGNIWSFLVPSEPAVYLLITNEQLAPAFEPLVQRRTEQGFPGRLLTVENIYASYPGVDGPVQIRNCIFNHYVNYGTQYVALGGDEKVVPVRYCDPKSKGLEMPADLYYADMDGGDWDANRNGIYGEMGEVTEIELIPEIHLGRIPLQTSEDAATYINKVVTYETASPDGFANSMILFGYWSSFVSGNARWSNHRHHDPVQGAEFRQMYVYDYFIQRYWQATPLHFLWHGYSSWDTEVCGDYDLTPEHLSEKLNQGYHFAFDWNHGKAGRWGVTRRGFTSEHAAALTNAIPGIVTAFSCSSADFDTDGTCMSEAFLQNPHGGAVAYFGFTGATNAHKHIYELFRALFETRPISIGEAITLCMIARAPDEDVIEQYNFVLHGDPCIQLLWEESGRNLQVLQPMGCEIIEKGSNLNIRWNANGTGFAPSEKVKLEYSPDSGHTWHPIPGAETLPYNGSSFKWKKCPFPAESNYRIRVVSLSDPSVTDMSGRDFTIGDMALLTVQSSPVESIVINLSGSKTDDCTLVTDFNITILEGATVSLSAPAVGGDSSEFTFVRWKDESGNTITTTPNYTFTITRDKTLVAEYAGP